jgi:peptidoglycan hydrolase CwlO-like protein
MENHLKDAQEKQAELEEEIKSLEEEIENYFEV